MADLYTSQVHLKRLLAGQATPAFTPVTVDVAKVIRPEYVPGMGALNEDEAGRLQCPVCGEWHFYLGNHAHHSHRAIGGMKAIRAALGIPAHVSLLSKKERDRRREFTAHIKAVRPHTTKGRFARGDGRGGARRDGIYADRQISIHSHNWADTCPAQLAERMDALRRDLGRSPSQSDFKRAYGEGGLKAVVSVFGTWNNAKAMVGLELLTHGDSRLEVALVVESLRAWVEIHGDLPTTGDTKDTARAPRIPSEKAIRGAFGVDNWPAAMRSAAEHLDFKSERYGAPTRRSA